MSNGSLIDILQIGSYAFAAAAIFCLLIAEALFFSARKKPKNSELQTASAPVSVPVAAPAAAQPAVSSYGETMQLSDSPYKASKLEDVGKTRELGRRRSRRDERSASAEEFRIIKEVMLIHSDEEIC